MSERAKIIVKIALLVVSVVAVALLIFSASECADRVQLYKSLIASDSLTEGWESTVDFYRGELKLFSQQLAGNIIGIICLAGLNAYIWFFHKIPSAEERAAAERKEKKKQKLQEELDKLEK